MNERISPSPAECHPQGAPRSSEGVWAETVCAEGGPKGLAPCDLALIEHDLRAAFADTLAGLSLIDRSQLDAPGRAQLERALSAAGAASRLIGLVAASLRGGGPASARVPLPVLLDDAAARWSLRAPLTLTGDALTAAVSVERLPMERALGNLLANATKFCPDGPISLDVSHREGGGLSLTLRDAGPGFSDAALALLFHPYGRPEGSVHPGSGLGLHIAAEAARAMGGRLQGGNRTDRSGAEMRLDLPASALEPLEAGPEADLAGLHVLLAEDSDSVRLATAQMLRRAGARVTEVTGGHEAIAEMARRRFDLVLLDMEMPRGCGRAVLMAPEARGQAIVVLTGHSSPALRAEVLALGARDMLEKPLTDPRKLASDLRAALAQPSEAAPVIDRATLQGLLHMAGPDLAQELMTRLDRDLSTAGQALTAAIDSLDTAALRAQSHVLIGLAGTIGATDLLERARALNLAAHAGDHGASAAQARATAALTARVCAALKEVSP